MVATVPPSSSRRPSAQRRQDIRHRLRRRLPAAVRRSTQQGLALAAVTVSVLLCATALATLVTLAGSSVGSGQIRRLAADPDTRVSVTASFDTAGMAAADRDVRAAADRVFAGAPERTYVGLVGTAPVAVKRVDGGTKVPDGPGGSGLHPIAVQDGRAFGQLVAGRWPAGAADAAAGAFTALPSVRVGTGSTAPVDAAVPEPLARRLGLRPGSRVQVQDAFSRTMELRISAVFRASGAAGFWSAMAGDGSADESAGEKVLLVPAAAVNGSAVLNGHLTAHWSVQPDFARLGAGDLTGLRDRVRAFAGSHSNVSVFRGKQPPLDDLKISSGLPGAIDQLALPAVAARSELYLPSVMLAVLALATLVLAGRQTTVRRRGELALQQARGSGTLRLLRGAGVEWALTGVPAALAAPYVAGLLHPGSRGSGAWAAVGLTLLVHAGAVLLPALPQVRLSAARNPRAAVAQRLGADLALLAVAVLGYLELRRHHSLVGAGSGSNAGGLSVDPVLVLVPAAASGAAALLLLRLLPLTSRLLDAFGRRSRTLVGALAGWQLSRRSARNAGPIVLMCLAVSASAFATTALACLGGLTTEQAAYTVGADVRVAPTGQDGYSATVLGGAYRALPAVTGVAPVTRTPANLPGGATEDLVGTLGGPAPRPRSPIADGITLPGRPTALLLDETLRSDGDSSAPVLSLTLQDADGLQSTVSAALPAADGARHTLVVPLGLPQSGGHPRTYPLTVSALNVLPKPGVRAARLDLRLHRVGSRGATDSWATALPAGQVWTDGTTHAADVRAAACGKDGPDSYAFIGAPGVCAILPGSPGVLHADVSTGFRDPKYAGDAPPGQDSASVEAPTAPGGQVRLVAGPAGGPAPLPVVADATALRDGHLTVGSTTTLDVGLSSPVTAKIVGVPASLRGLGRGQGHLIADQRQLAAALTLAGGLQKDPAFWRIDSSDTSRTAAAVAAEPALGHATTTASAAAALQADPFRRGLHRVLELVRLLAPAFAVVAFTVHAVVSTRQRRKEFALLRAIGIRSQGLSVLLGAEQLGLVLFAVIPGALMGMALASTVLPLVTLDDTGHAPYPPLPVVLPWATVALVTALTAVAIGAVVLLLARLLARVDLVRVLRAGEDR
ncbi:ABC transporter permease [Streptomyces cocklensis]|uniref:FtsX-like permease family protein n=1 Tax=Actinacidiphila cocklensis TaxID=887465 RepID=A0A9W4DZT9_9ACTN|nr:ABC transporter permease [Actinacidiphila cocklensis]MDD1058758.1 ABC transporter permease [Actinacidiphila cocklensis]CAG6398874.1 FtsX-like permease family protein [Actinacidiphila cocklensis]